MKIISKYKDYYDYLNGIWGIDPTIVLDRTKFDILYPDITGFNDYYVYEFCICGKLIYGYKLRNVDKILFLNDLLPYVEKSKWTNIFYFKKEYCQDSRSSHKPINTTILEDKIKLNEKEDCPIIIKHFNNIYKFPILSNFNFIKAMPAETIYNLLCEWLGRDKIKINTIDNASKIELYGFDKKTSFRNM